MVNWCFWPSGVAFFEKAKSSENVGHVSKKYSRGPPLGSSPRARSSSGPAPSHFLSGELFSRKSEKSVFWDVYSVSDTFWPPRAVPWGDRLMERYAKTNRKSMFLMMRFYDFCKNVEIPLRFKGFSHIAFLQKKSCAFLPNLVGPEFPTFGSQKRKSAREEQFGLPF